MKFAVVRALQRSKLAGCVQRKAGWRRCLLTWLGRFASPQFSGCASKLETQEEPMLLFKSRGLQAGKSLHPRENPSTPH